MRTRDVTFDELKGYDPKDLLEQPPEVIETIRMYALEQPDLDEDEEDFHSQLMQNIALNNIKGGL